jgi:hypothetical protein
LQIEPDDVAPGGPITGGATYGIGRILPSIRILTLNLVFEVKRCDMLTPSIQVALPAVSLQRQFDGQSFSPPILLTAKSLRNLPEFCINLLVENPSDSRVLFSTQSNSCLGVRRQITNPLSVKEMFGEYVDLAFVLNKPYLDFTRLSRLATGGGHVNIFESCKI